jgi:predicted amidophosphoribosyltransferase
MVDLVVPKTCPACRVGFEGDTVFCGGCDASMVELESAARCVLCAMPLVMAGAPCAQCVGSGISPFDQIVALGVLKPPLRETIHAGKYRGRWSLMERLADRLLNRSDAREMLASADWIIPVPLFHRRQVERGFNQAEVIARRLCEQLNRHHALPILRPMRSLFDRSNSRNAWRRLFPAGDEKRLKLLSAARRLRDTQTQTIVHSKLGRADNVKGAFELIDGSKIEDKQVILVDDVMTTGATLRSLAREVNKANPRSISAIVLAVADPKGRAFEVI